MLSRVACYTSLTCNVYMAADEYTAALRYFLSKRSEYTLTGTPKALDLGRYTHAVVQSKL